MPTRRIRIDGREWQVFPSGFITQSVADEFGLIFVHQAGEQRDVRVTRYAPVGGAASTAREQSLVELSETQLRELFRTAQPGDRSPEAGYRA